MSESLANESVPCGPWQLFVNPESKAMMTKDSPRAGAIRVDIETAKCEQPWQINVFRLNFPLSKENVYSIRFSARSEKARTATVSVSEGRPPWEPLSLMTNLDLTPQWRSFQVPLQPAKSVANAQLMISLGSSDVSVEIADFALMKLDSKNLDNETASFPPSSWQTSTTADATAKLVDTGAESFRVELGALPSLEDWHVNVWTSGFPLQANVPYALRFRARADEDRVVGVDIDENQPPWQNLGLRESVVLTPEWKNRSLEFVSPRTDLNAKLQFRIGGSNVPVEIADVRIEPAKRVADIAGTASLVVAAVASVVVVLAIGYSWRVRGHEKEDSQRAGQRDSS